MNWVGAVKRGFTPDEFDHYVKNMGTSGMWRPQGIARSEAYKSKMRESLNASEVHREKMKSEETRAKMRKAAQGKTLSDDHKRRIGAASRETWAKKKEALNATVEGHC